MSYLVLARKSRPQTFDEVVGQKPVVKTLKNSILRDRVAHAILFSGVRGVGKTTLARIMAKAINCQAEIKERPCNKCQSCIDISRGQSLDVIEIDGASNNGVDDIRTLRENIKAQPAASRYKIVIIDEVHMLSTSAFNALLKTLEEPPDHVYFMFATTEIHKIPVTILSRCQQYELKKVSADELSRHFQKLAEGEGFSLDQAALSLIVRESGGSIRDGLSLLDQMFSFGEKEISQADVVEILGLVGKDILIQITSALLKNDRIAAFSGLQQVFQYGVDLRRFLEDLLITFRNLFFCATGCQQLVDLPEIELLEMQQLAYGINPENIHLKLALLMEAAEQVQRAAHPRFVLETSFMKIIEAGNVVPLSAILCKMETLLPELKQLEPVPTPSIPSFSTPSPTEYAAKGEENNPEKKPENQEHSSVQMQSPGSFAERENELKQSDFFPDLQESETSSPQPEISLPDEDLIELEETAIPTRYEDQLQTIKTRWKEFIEYVKVDKIWLATVLTNTDNLEFSGYDPVTVHLYYNNREDCLLLSQNDNFKILQQLALDFFGAKLSLELHQPGKDEITDEDSPRARRNKLAKDPLVRMTEEVFRGQVGAIRLSSLVKKK